MSRIDDLIAEYCPEGVPFYQLSEISQTLPGLSGKTKGDFSDGNARYVSYKNVFSNIAVNQSTQDLVKVGSNEKQNRLHLGDVIITGSSESLNEVGLSSVVDDMPHEPLYLNSFCFIVRVHDPQTLLPGFSKYLFRAESVRAQIRGTASGVTRINISKPRFMKVRIPVPPLEVQREIVRVLDQFTQLEAELEAELEARRRQYQHYRSFLLTPSDEMRWSTLGDVSVKVSSGGTPSSDRADYYGGDIPWLRTQEVDYTDIASTSIAITESGLKNSSAKWIPENCVIVAMYGATAAKAAINAIPLTTNQACCNLQIDPAVADFRYVFYWVSNEYEGLKSKGEGSQSNLNAKKVKAYPIPVPSLERQHEVVAALENFDALTTNLCVGLPAELAARRKQYEYYRENLLTFVELPT